MIRHWPEYAAECIGVALMLTVGLSAVVANFADDSAIANWSGSEGLRRLVTGAIFAGTATVIVYSPLGKRSGGHLNPAVTLAFYRLGKIAKVDAIYYVLAQLLGAFLGAGLVLLLWNDLAVSIDVGLTLPGSRGPWVAALAEVAMTFTLVLLILSFVDYPPFARLTGVAAGSLVALLVFLLAPVSGTSLNPARSLGPAVWSANLHYLWIYLIAPFAGSLSAVWLFTRFRETTICAKLSHPDGDTACIFVCGYRDSQGQ